MHFAGHSLGGITANNLADNQDFLDDYNVKTVTTFGAPVSARENPDVTYTRFRNATDPVPALDPELLDPDTRYKAVEEYASQTAINSGANGLHAHMEDQYVKALQSAGCPPLPEGLNISQWNEQGNYSSERQSTPTEDAITNTGLLIPADVIFEGNRTLILGAANHSIDKLLVLPMPESLRDGIDRYRDRVNQDIMSLPTPTEATGKAIDEVRETAGEAIDEVQEMGREVKDFLKDKLLG